MPRSLLPDMIEKIETIAAKYGVLVTTVAHAGDGNLHPVLVPLRRPFAPARRTPRCSARWASSTPP